MLPEDPDVLALQAYVSWNVGTTRDTEYEAARLSALALENTQQESQAFALLPLAANYLDAYMTNPLPDEVAQHVHNSLHQADEVATEFMPIALLQERQAVAKEKLQTLSSNDLVIQTAAIRHILDFNEAANKVISHSTIAYFEMLEEHVNYQQELAEDFDNDPEKAGIAIMIEDFLPDDGVLPLNPEELNEDFSEWNEAQKHQYNRLRQAYKVVNAWRDFDNTLRDNYWLANSTTALAAFRLNDAMYTRAAWFVFNPDSYELAPTLTGEINNDGEWQDKLLHETLAVKIDVLNDLNETDDETADTLQIQVNALLQKELEDRLAIAPPRLILG